MFHTFQISEGKGDGETKTNNNTPRDILQTLPIFMQRQILAFFGYKDHTLVGRTSPQLYALWKEARERMARDGVRVPEDCNTLKEAVDRVHGDDGLTTIVVGKGEHRIDGEYLEISSAMNIVGDPGVGDPGVAKSEIVVVGGIWFEKGIQGNCHLQHLTLRKAWSCGVLAESSFTMEEVLVEQCSEHGVRAEGPGVVARCTNVEVRQCELGGVWALNGASITLIGGKTTVHHNCVDEYEEDYGLAVSDTSTIQLLAPLTKEIVSVDNGGGRNWGVDVDGGDINLIKTINE